MTASDQVDTESGVNEAQHDSRLIRDIALMTQLRPVAFGTRTRYAFELVEVVLAGE